MNDELSRLYQRFCNDLSKDSERPPPSLAPSIDNDSDVVSENADAGEMAGVSKVRRELEWVIAKPTAQQLDQAAIALLVASAAALWLLALHDRSFSVPPSPALFERELGRYAVAYRPNLYLDPTAVLEIRPIDAGAPIYFNSDVRNSKWSASKQAWLPLSDGEKRRLKDLVLPAGAVVGAMLFAWSRPRKAICDGCPSCGRENRRGELVEDAPAAASAGSQCA